MSPPVSFVTWPLAFAFGFGFPASRTTRQHFCRLAARSLLPEPPAMPAVASILTPVEADGILPQVAGTSATVTASVVADTHALQTLCGRSREGRQRSLNVLHRCTPRQRYAPRYFPARSS